MLRIRLRVNGVLQEQIVKEKQIAAALLLRIKLISGLNISERRLPQDGRFQMTIKDRKIDARLSTLPIQHGESAVMRLLDQSSEAITLDRLGMEPALLKHLRQLVHHPHGIWFC